MQKRRLKLKYTALLMFVLLVVSIFLGGVTFASASNSSSTSSYCNPPPNAQPGQYYCLNCGGGGNGCSNPAATGKCGSNNCDLIKTYLNPAINLISGLVGIIVVIGVIIGAVQYASSAGDPQKAAKARGKIAKSLIALIAFGFLYFFLQWIVPGGIFNG